MIARTEQHGPGRGWLPGPLAALSRSVKGSPLNAMALALVFLVCLIALLAGLAEIAGVTVTPYDPLAPDLRARLKAPTLDHPFGTDQLGRDILSRVFMGTRISIQIALSVLAIAAGLGILVGIVAGLLGGLVDEILMRIADLFLAFPALILAAAISASLGGSLATTTIALAAVFWPWYARVARSRVLSLRTQQFVTASISMGASRTRLVFRSMLPLVWPTVVVQATTDAGFVMLAIAGLSFLGLGAKPPTPEWGSMILASLSFQPTSWWLAVFPGAALGISAFAFNLLGDGLRDYLDPSHVSGKKLEQGGR